MPRRRSSAADLPTDNSTILDTDVATEMRTSYLEYAYSVIYSRAIPDARDGLKPVQRRILYQMAQMNLRPDRGHVKSARVVGEVMGKLHPHGDAAIYDALVRMAQSFSLRLPLVDGHGNFGSLDDGPAAPRYTEARLAPAAMVMTADLDEDVVDFIPNYDNQFTQPVVLPSALPNLLVNGASGIAVGMATNMPPHNLREVIAAARHLIAHPEATLEDLMRLVPGPDLPGGGKIIGLDGIREAYESGRGRFKTRATTRIERVSARKQGIIVTELPYQVGPERVIEKIKGAVQGGKLKGISAVNDLTDRQHGLRMVIEVKNGFNPEGVLQQLYKHTTMEESFGINNVTLVNGQPQTLGLKELLQVYVDHRINVVRRRSQYRLDKKRERAHLVAGLLIALLDIDEVIEVIRTSEDAATARDRLMVVFDLSEIQSDYILELRLRRLTKFSRLELESERDELARAIAELEEILADEGRLHQLVSDELAAVAAEHGDDRRTVLLESGPNAPSAASGADVQANGVPLEIADSPCRVLLSTTGLLARSTDDCEPIRSGRRSAHDALLATVRTTTRGSAGAVTNKGRVLKFSALDLPALPPTDSPVSLSGGVPLAEIVPLESGERVVGLVSIDEDAAPIALATAAGGVKRVTAQHPNNKDAWEIVSLREGDEVVAAAHAADEDELVFISTDARLLHYRSANVRPQGRSAAGMAGIKLAEGQQVLSFGVVASARFDDAVVVTIAGSSHALDGTQFGSAKVTPLAVYPSKGRATGGVRCQRFIRGEDTLLKACVAPDPVRAVGGGGQPVALPGIDDRRDGSGHALTAPVASLG